MRKINLPCYRIRIDLDDSGTSGRIESDGLHLDYSYQGPDVVAYEAAINAIEFMVLAHACAGVDVETPGYMEGIETAVEAVVQHYDC